MKVIFCSIDKKERGGTHHQRRAGRGRAKPARQFGKAEPDAMMLKEES